MDSPACSITQQNYLVADRQLDLARVLDAAAQSSDDGFAVFTLHVPHAPGPVEDDAARHSLSSLMTSHHFRDGAGSFERISSSRISFTFSSVIAPSAACASAAVVPQARNGDSR